MAFVSSHLKNHVWFQTSCGQKKDGNMKVSDKKNGQNLLGLGICLKSVELSFLFQHSEGINITNEDKLFWTV